MSLKSLPAGKSVIAALAAAGAIAATGLAVQQNAVAATNGQSIEFCTNADARWVKASGKNPDGVDIALTVNMMANRDSRGCVPYDPNVRWKGQVHLTWTSEIERNETDCHVPVESEKDFVTCFDYDRKQPDLGWGLARS
ncbi:MAG TPA: hypothetical protein VI248_14785 [Kineosporiaceae bacterium]